jgi:hypothetical protein
MKNQLISDRLRRDTATVALLTSAHDRYTDIEFDIAPLREQLSANVLAAADLTHHATDTVAHDDATPRQQGLRSQLTELLQRRIKALRAHAKGLKPAPDLDLLGSLPTHFSSLSRRTDAEFPREARRILHLGHDVSADALTTRRYSPEHQQKAEQLLHELSTTDGASVEEIAVTGRHALERLVKANDRLIADLDEFFALYNDQDDVEALMLYGEWRTATTVKLRSGKKGKRDQVTTEQEQGD